MVARPSSAPLRMTALKRAWSDISYSQAPYQCSPHHELLHQLLLHQLLLSQSLSHQLLLHHELLAQSGSVRSMGTVPPWARIPSVWTAGLPPSQTVPQSSMSGESPIDRTIAPWFPVMVEWAALYASTEPWPSTSTLCGLSGTAASRTRALTSS